MTTPMAAGCGLMLSAALAVLYALVARGWRTIDDTFYREMGRGRRAPRPYCRRWLLPALCGSDDERWKAAALLAFVASGPVLVYYATGLGLTPARALVASALVLTLSQLGRFGIEVPVLVDGPAFTLAVGSAAAVLNGHPVLGVLLAVLAGATKETAPLMACALSLSPVPLVGLVLGPGWWRTPLEGRDLPAAYRSWLERPFAAALATRAVDLLDRRRMLYPWQALIVAPAYITAVEPRLAATAIVSAAVAYAQLFAAQDGPRLYLWSAPAVAAVLAAGASEPLLALACALSIWFPSQEV